MAYDIHVLVQSLLFFVIVIFGLIVSVPLGVTVMQLDDQCILYPDISWVNATYAKYELSSPGYCNFPVFFAVFSCIFYGLGMGAYYGYAALKSKDPNIGYQMWIMPFLLLNALILIVTFIGCCIVSVGFKSFCDQFLEGRNKGSVMNSCSDCKRMNWNKNGKTDNNFTNCYTFPKTTETAGWITFLIWCVQFGLCVLRFIRNRRLRSKDMAPEPVTPTSGRRPEDLENFASAQPTA